MKRLLICSFGLVICSWFATPASALAQSTTATLPTSEQSLQELVKEVRQLRAALQRMNAAVYKGQVILEQLKLQQEQVARIGRELRDTRDSLSEVRAQQVRLTELLGRVETEIEAGIQREADRTNLKAEINLLNQREQRTITRDTQLANELEIEHAKLNELNQKLNLLLEQEISPR